MKNKKKIYMIGPDKSVKGGIASVVQGYLTSELINKYNIEYISTHKDGSKINKLFVAINGYIKILKSLIINKPDLVHIHTSFGASFYRKSLVIIMCNIFNVEIINHIHGAEFDKFYTNASKVKKILIKRIYNKCKYTIVLSQEWKERIEQISDKSNISVITNYADSPEKVPNIDERKDIVVFLGEIGQRKGVYDIPQIINEVKKINKNIKFYICGNGDHEKLKLLIKEYCIEKQVIVKDWIDKEQKDQLLRSSKVFLLPSYNEGVPMAILEGMAYGNAIVSTLVGGIPSVIESGVNGFLSKPGDIIGLSNSIINIIDNKMNQQNMFFNNRELISSKYSLKSHTNKINALYEQIVKKGDEENN